METLPADPNADCTTAHSNATGVHTSQGTMAFIPDTADGFHTYGVLWTATDLTWYVDDMAVFHAATPADMNKPMYMLANLALGGWSGAIDNSQPAGRNEDRLHPRLRPARRDGDQCRRAGRWRGCAPPPPPPAPTYSNTLFDLAQSGASTKSFIGGARPDTLTGTSGNDLLDGMGNSDTLKGGPGDDTYGVDRAGDQVIEASGQGIDTVVSTSPSYTLAANVENLKLTGKVAQAGIGNELNNRLTSNDAGSTLNGGAGNDILIAGRGADMLTGGAGKDIFEFDKAPAKAGHITDFTAGQDMIDLRGLFGAANYVGTDPVADHHLELRADGAGGTAIYFDADGSGAGAPVLVTTVDHILPTALTAQNDWFFH